METEERSRFRAGACGGYPGRGCQERIRAVEFETIAAVAPVRPCGGGFGAESAIAGNLTVFGSVRGRRLDSGQDDIVEMLKAVEASTM